VSDSLNSFKQVLSRRLNLRRFALAPDIATHRDLVFLKLLGRFEKLRRAGPTFFSSAIFIFLIDPLHLLRRFLDKKSWQKVIHAASIVFLCS
jgi:hypothetical protein